MKQYIIVQRKCHFKNFFHKFLGANPTLRDHGRGLRAEQWARFCGRYVCAEMIERFARHRLLERTTSCRWGSEPELAAKVLQGKVC